MAPDRRRRGVQPGWAVAWSGVGVGAATVAAAIAVSLSGHGGLRGALTHAIWGEFSDALWWAAAVTILAGGLLVVAASGRIPQLDLAAEARRVARVVTRRPTRRRAQLLRAVALVVVGGGAVLRPALVWGALGGLLGVMLLVVGAAELARLAGATRRVGPVRSARQMWGLGWGVGVVLVVALALVVALVGVDASPAKRLITVATDSTACNGHVQLCDRPYNDVSFVGTHNSMSAADEPGWFIPEQPDGLIAQLNAGVRVLLIDSWYGQQTTQPDLVATAPDSYQAAVTAAKQDFGTSAVESLLRLHDAVTPTRVGPVLPYLCHGACEIGATQWEPAMVEVRQWLAAHPREVVTIFVEDYVTPADTAQVFQQAGLLPSVYTPAADGRWPTLGQMIDSGHRLVVLMENHGGGAAYPWLMDGPDWVQDNPYGSRTASAMSCALNRGSASNSILLLNYWLTNDFRTLVTDARKVNAYSLMSPFVTKCRQQRGMIPNYVAVNFYNEGDVFRVVDELNGFS